MRQVVANAVRVRLILDGSKLAVWQINQSAYSECCASRIDVNRFSKLRRSQRCSQLRKAQTERRPISPAQSCCDAHQRFPWARGAAVAHERHREAFVTNSASILDLGYTGNTTFSPLRVKSLHKSSPMNCPSLVAAPVQPFACRCTTMRSSDDALLPREPGAGHAAKLVASRRGSIKSHRNWGRA